MAKAELFSAAEKAAALAKPGSSRYLVGIQSLPEAMEAARLTKIENDFFSAPYVEETRFFPKRHEKAELAIKNLEVEWRGSLRDWESGC